MPRIRSWPNRLIGDAGTGPFRLTDVAVYRGRLLEERDVDGLLSEGE